MPMFEMAESGYRESGHWSIAVGLDSIMFPSGKSTNLLLILIKPKFYPTYAKIRDDILTICAKKNMSLVLRGWGCFLISVLVHPLVV